MSLDFSAIRGAQADVSLRDLPSMTVKSLKTFGHWIIASPPSQPKLSSTQKFVRWITLQKEQPVATSWNSQRMFTVAGRMAMAAVGITAGVIATSGAAGYCTEAIGLELKGVAASYKERVPPKCMLIDPTVSCPQQVEELQQLKELVARLEDECQSRLAFDDIIPCLSESEYQQMEQLEAQIQKKCPWSERIITCPDYSLLVVDTTLSLGIEKVASVLLKASDIFYVPYNGLTGLVTQSIQKLWAIQ